MVSLALFEETEGDRICREADLKPLDVEILRWYYDEDRRVEVIAEWICQSVEGTKSRVRDISERLFAVTGIRLYREPDGRRVRELSMEPDLVTYLHDTLTN